MCNINVFFFFFRCFEGYNATVFAYGQVGVIFCTPQLMKCLFGLVISTLEYRSQSCGFESHWRLHPLCCTVASIIA